MFYVYIYYHPETDLPFYVGKGTGNRLYVHLQESYQTTENKKKYAVIENLRRKGLEPRIEKIAEFEEEKAAYDLEAMLIAKYGRHDIDEGGILTNICTDNRPPDTTGRVMSEEQKQYLSRTRKGEANPMYGKKFKMPEHAIKRGEENPFYGRTHSDETKSIMAEKKIGNKHRLGKTFTQDARDRIGRNNPRRRDIVTPYGEFESAEAFADKYSGITANGLRNWLKDPNRIVSKGTWAMNKKLLEQSDIGKTFKELGYYYK